MISMRQLAAIFCGIAATAVAQADESLTTTTPDDNIVITANRAPTPVRDVGSSFSIVERPIVEQRQSILATDLLQDLPGVAVSRSGPIGSQTQVRIRGAEANQVLVMIDGIEVNDIASNDEFDFANLTTYDIDRIEVVRGPQSALWGSDAMAGVINVITRKADRPLDVSAFLEGGSFNTINGGGRIGAASEKGNVSLGASYLDSDGTNISRGGDEKDGYQNLTTTLNAGYDPLDNLKLDMVVRYTDAENDFDNADFGAPVDANRRTDQSRTYAQLRGLLSLMDNFWEQQLRMTWVDTDNKSYEDDAWTSTQAGEKLGLYYQTGLNLTRNSDGQATNALILAVDYEKEDFRQRGIVQPWGDPNRDESLDNTGLVAEYLTTPLEPWAISLSVRYDNNSDFDDVTTWRATTSYAFESTGTRLRASAGTGQKRPTFTERFGFFTNFVGNPNLKPERSTGWDIGIDQSVFTDRLQLNLTYFSEELKDEINGFFFDAGTGGFTAVNRDGTSDRTGVEFAFAADLAAGLDLTGSYTYTDSSETTSTGSSTQELRRPRHMAAANLNYRFIRDRANVNLNVSYTGDQLDDDFGTFPATRVALDAYTLVNLAAEFAVTDMVAVYGRVENLFDEDYANVFGFAPSGIGGFVGARIKFSN
jgi:vitamin B12 transporter